MIGKIDRRLEELGIVLPTPGNPGGHYVPFVRVGPLVFMSGQPAAFERQGCLHGEGEPRPFG